MSEPPFGLGDDCAGDAQNVPVLQIENRIHQEGEIIALLDDWQALDQKALY
jgi:hypothetical protein